MFLFLPEMPLPVRKQQPLWRMPPRIVLQNYPFKSPPEQEYPRDAPDVQQKLEKSFKWTSGHQFNVDLANSCNLIGMKVLRRFSVRGVDKGSFVGIIVSQKGGKYRCLFCDLDSRTLNAREVSQCIEEYCQTAATYNGPNVYMFRGMIEYADYAYGLWREKAEERANGSDTLP